MTPLRSSLIAAVPWVEHGFGTRHDAAWTPAAETARVKQVHGNGIVPAIHPGHWGEGDALVTDVSGLWLEVRTADCVPILLVDTDSRRVAAVHAGWRGTAAQIVARSVERLLAEGAGRADAILAAIGPAIGPCCFAVGPEVAAEFPGEISYAGEQACVDLNSANRRQLLEAGLRPEQIETLSVCTVCQPEFFYSFRRAKDTGRMVTAIRIIP